MWMTGSFSGDTGKGRLQNKLKKTNRFYSAAVRTVRGGYFVYAILKREYRQYPETEMNPEERKERYDDEEMDNEEMLCVICSPVLYHCPVFRAGDC